MVKLYSSVLRVYSPTVDLQRCDLRMNPHLLHYILSLIKVFQKCQGEFFRLLLGNTALLANCDNTVISIKWPCTVALHPRLQTMENVQEITQDELRV